MEIGKGGSSSGNSPLLKGWHLAHVSLQALSCPQFHVVLLLPHCPPRTPPPPNSPLSYFLPAGAYEGNLQLPLPNPILLAFLAISFWFSSSTEMELN